MYAELLVCFRMFYQFYSKLHVYIEIIKIFQEPVEKLDYKVDQGKIALYQIIWNLNYQDHLEKYARRVSLAYQIKKIN